MRILSQRNPTCSPRCQGILRRTKERPSVELVGPVSKTWPPAYLVQEARASKPSVFASGRCLWCGEWFTHDTRITGVVSRYCSDKCAKRFHKASRQRRHGRFGIPRRRRLDIYERDNWMCQLCGDPVDQALHHLDNMAASLDHIECQSWALVPNHSDANLRLAHRLCNSLRSDQP